MSLEKVSVTAAFVSPLLIKKCSKSKDCCKSVQQICLQFPPLCLSKFSFFSLLVSFFSFHISLSPVFFLAHVGECGCASCTLIGAKHQFWQGGFHIRPSLCAHTHKLLHERARSSQLVIVDAAGSLSPVLSWMNLGPNLVSFQRRAH